MRPMPDVLDAVIEAVPDSYEGKAALKKSFEVAKAIYSSCETDDQKSDLWAMPAGSLASALGWPPDEPWKVEVLEIMQAKRDYRLYLKTGSVH